MVLHVWRDLVVNYFDQVTRNKHEGHITILNNMNNILQNQKIKQLPFTYVYLAGHC